MTDVSIIIPTYNRPNELRDCLESILKQSVKPMEVIVVDDGNLGDPPLKQEFISVGIQYILFKKDRPGLTESRNVGVKLAKGQIIFFLDDDVVLFPDYVEQILKVYKERDGFIGGVGGYIDNEPPLRSRDLVKHYIEMLFLAWSPREGRVLPSGFSTPLGESPFPFRDITEVDFLSGGVSSFHRKIFEEYSFTERYHDIALNEDQDFSVMVSRRYPLFVNPNARLLHFHSSAMRPNERIVAKKFILGNYLLFRRFIMRGWWYWPMFWYAVFGTIITRGLSLMISPFAAKSESLLGMIDAVFLIIQRKVPDLGNVK